MKTVPDIAKVLTDLSIPSTLHKRLLPFARIISSQVIKTDAHGLLVMLETIEQLYYTVDIVVNFQKSIANTDSNNHDQIGFNKKDIKKLKTIIKLFDQSISSFKVYKYKYYYIH